MSEVELFDVVDQYYLDATTQEQDQCTRGQIYWCPCLYFNQSLKILRPTEIDPTGRPPSSWQTQKVEPRSFNDPPHEPLLSPRLRADEEFVVLTAKKRPVILLSSKAEEWTYRSGKTRQECFLIAPMYSFDDRDSPVWKLRTRALAYRELFYLPGVEALGMKEGFVRFDRAHVVPKGWLSRKHVCLHPTALSMLTEWFRYYLTDTADDFILEYRAEFLRLVDEALGTTME